MKRMSRPRALGSGAEQQDLFDPDVAAALERRGESASAPRRRRARLKQPRAGAMFRIVGEADLPRYPPALIELVERALEAAPHERAWFTYKDIAAYFGVSRATVARRLKDALVPGVRMQDGHVLSDGPFRRFDRTQVRWLLLAVGYRRCGQDRNSDARNPIGEIRTVAPAIRGR